MILLPLVLNVASALPLSGHTLTRGSAEPAANISIESEGLTIAESDERGHFSLDLTPGPHTLQFIDPGFLPYSVELTLPLDAPLKVYLSTAPNHEIVVESFRETSHASRHVVDAEIARKTPGTLEDAVRLVQSLPGVTVQREYTPGQGDLSVRGSSPGDNRYFLDGIEVPYLYHFGQYASVFPTSQIDELELFPSTFGAPFGDAVGGVIDARSQTKQPKALHGDVNLSLVMAGASVTAPLKNGWWFSGSARRTYQDYLKSSPQYTVWPRFNDYALRVGKEDKTKHTQIFSWGAGDTYARTIGELDILDPAEQARTPSFSYTRAFQVLGVEHHYQTPKTENRLITAIVRDAIDAQLSSSGGARTRMAQLQARYDLTHRPSEHFSFKTGLQLHTDQTTINMTPAGPERIAVSKESPLLAYSQAINVRQLRTRVALYGEAHLITGNLRVIPGVRLNTDTLGAPAVVQPRFAIRYHPADQTEFKWTMGRYYQNPRTEQLVGSPDLPGTDSWQISSGVEQTVANRLELSLDSYYKRLKNVLVFPLDSGPIVRPSGDAWGVELVTRYRMRETFFLWGWFAVARSHVNFTEGRRPQNSDQPVSTGIVASWDISDKWNIGLRYRYGSGLPWTPVKDSLYNASKDQWVPVPALTNSARYAPYHKIDLHIERQWVHDRWTLIAYAELWYVPKKSTQLYPTWNYNYQEQGWVRGPQTLPLAGLRAQF